MFKNILVPIDLNHLETATKPLSVAIELCEIHGSKLHFISVIPGFGMPWVAIHFAEDTMEKAQKSVAATLSDFAKENVPEGLLLSQHISTGQSYREILNHCEKIGADLIIIQSHNPRGVEKVLLGSVTAKVVENSKVSVLVIRA